MAVQTGRTVGKWIKFQIDDSGGIMRDILVYTVGGVGISYDQVELTALQDVLGGFLPGHGTVAIPITGPYDTAVAQAASGSGAAPALSGSHTVLEPVNGGNTPLGFGIYIGVRHYWETGEQVFGLTASAANGILVREYQVNLEDMSYSADLQMYPGSAAPAWGTAAIS